MITPTDEQVEAALDEYFSHGVPHGDARTIREIEAAMRAALTAYISLAAPAGTVDDLAEAVTAMLAQLEAEPLDGANAWGRFAETVDRVRSALLPPQPSAEPDDDAAEAIGPETEAKLTRSGPHLDVEWWKRGKQYRQRIYEPQYLPLSPALADLVVMAMTESQPIRVGEPLTESEIVALINRHFSRQTNPRAHEELTYEKSVPMFPQAAHDAPTVNIVHFVRDIEAHSALVSQPHPDGEAAWRDVLKKVRAQLGQAGGIGTAGAQNSIIEREVGGWILDEVEDQLSTLYLHPVPHNEGLIKALKDYDRAPGWTMGQRLAEAVRTVTFSSRNEPPISSAIRVCPERDGRCPHGMGCRYMVDQYHCDIAASRAALSKPAGGVKP